MSWLGRTKESKVIKLSPLQQLRAEAIRFCTADRMEDCDVAIREHLLKGSAIVKEWRTVFAQARDVLGAAGEEDAASALVQCYEQARIKTAEQYPGCHLGLTHSGRFTLEVDALLYRLKLPVAALPLNQRENLFNHLHIQQLAQAYFAKHIEQTAGWANGDEPLEHAKDDLKVMVDKAFHGNPTLPAMHIDAFEAELKAFKLGNHAHDYMDGAARDWLKVHEKHAQAQFAHPALGIKSEHQNSTSIRDFISEVAKHTFRGGSATAGVRPRPSTNGSAVSIDPPAALISARVKLAELIATDKGIELQMATSVLPKLEQYLTQQVNSTMLGEGHGKLAVVNR